MALESEVTNKSDNEEDDFGCYFLQPTASPYNITEKVQQANFDLFTSIPQSTRSTKVKFRDELISFEPDLTDDDVNSIESDHVEEVVTNSEENFQANAQLETRILCEDVLRGGLGIYDIEEEVEDPVIEEEVFQSYEDDANVMQDGELTIELKKPETEEGEEQLSENRTESATKVSSDTVRISNRQKPPKRRKHYSRETEVHCKEHCIERLDSRLSMSIRKLELHDKPPINLPPLQLHQRKCCDEIKLTSSDRNLPIYNGYRSEYGLTSRQLKNRNRYIEMMRQKETARQKLIEEYRALKTRQNEEVFCQWLKEVSRRHHKEQENVRNFYKSGPRTPGSGSYQSPTVVNINKAVNKDKIKERPKTAGFVPKTAIKKKRRPHTTQSCVYIEVPPEILQKGVHIGDLLITNSKELSKKLHTLTVS